MTYIIYDNNIMSRTIFIHTLKWNKLRGATNNISEMKNSRGTFKQVNPFDEVKDY